MHNGFFYRQAFEAVGGKTMHVMVDEKAFKADENGNSYDKN